MSGLYVAANQIAVAKSYVGYHEGWQNYNTFSAWQYGDWHEPWCASFVSYCAYVAGFRWWNDCTYRERGDSNVGSLHQHADRQGVWRSKWTTARIGWAVDLSFGIPDQHVEMVVADNGGSIATIGGNTGDMVAYRVRSRDNVVGFVALDEAGQNLSGPTPQPIPETNVKPTDRICAVTPAPGQIYVLQADGGVFSYAGAPNGVPPTFWGSIPGEKTHPILVMDQDHAVSMCLHRDSKGVCQGYWIALFNGDVHTFGKGKYQGGFRSQLQSGERAVEILSTDDSQGYRLATSKGRILRPA